MTNKTDRTRAAETETDLFVPDAVVRRELSICPMTLWRWDRDPAKSKLGWPPPIQHTAGGRKYRSRNQLELFKQNVVRLAVGAHGKAK